MATEHNTSGDNQPSKEAQVKGGQHSHQGSQQGTHDKGGTQHDQGSGSQQSKTQDGRAHNQPSHEEQVKGGEHSHSGSQKK